MCVAMSLIVVAALREGVLTLLGLKEDDSRPRGIVKLSIVVVIQVDILFYHALIYFLSHQMMVDWSFWPL